MVSNEGRPPTAKAGTGAPDVDDGVRELTDAELVRRARRLGRGFDETRRALGRLEPDEATDADVDHVVAEYDVIDDDSVATYRTVVLELRERGYDLTVRERDAVETELEIVGPDGTAYVDGETPPERVGSSTADGVDSPAADGD